MTKETYNNIVNYLQSIIKDTLYDNHVYTVGGCCRDIIMGNDIKDIDLVVSLPNGGINFATWLEENGYLNGHVVTYPTYGTAMFKLKQYPDIELEAVQTRNEEYINRDSRKPSTAYGTIEEDCIRRDLTINAIYYNISTGSYKDVCGLSFEDLNNHIIRTPDDPNKTYEDDPLRILRCIRFATRFNWDIEAKTFEAMKENIYRLSIISSERINAEMFKILMSDNYKKGISLIYMLDALEYIIPEYWIGIRKTLKYDEQYDPINYLHDKTLEKCYYFLTQHITRNVLHNLKFDNEFINKVETYKRLVSKHGNLIVHNTYITDIPDWRIRQIQYDCKSLEIYNDFIDIINAIIRVIHTDSELLYKNPNNKELYHKIIFKMVNTTCNMFEYKLPINGDDIMSLGIPAGKQIRDILDTLFIEAFKNPDIDKEFCIEYIKKNFMKNETN